MWKYRVNTYIHNISEASSVIAGIVSYALWVILMTILLIGTPLFMWIPINRIERPKQ